MIKCLSAFALPLLFPVLSSVGAVLFNFIHKETEALEREGLAVTKKEAWPALWLRHEGLWPASRVLGLLLRFRDHP